MVDCMSDDHALVSPAEMTEACRIEANAARKLNKALIHLAQLLEADDHDFDTIEEAETDVTYCHRIYRAAKLHRKAVYEA